MIVQCPRCEKKYDLDQSHLAKGAIKVRCPNCKHVWVVSVESKRIESKPPFAPPPRPKLQEQFGRAANDVPKLLPVEDLITLRVLVGFLGEKPQYGWWETNFLSDIGLKYLRIVFPRSAFSAGMTSVAEAAKRLHDNRIGRGGVYHLFRLPEFIEQKIHRRLLELDPAPLLPWVESRDRALDKLNTLADGSFGDAEGPVQLGRARDLWQLSSLKVLARSYNHAFISGKQIFPYFPE